jgi:hypothetical protein
MRAAFLSREECATWRQGKKAAFKPLREGDRGTCRPSGSNQPFEVLRWAAVPSNELMGTILAAGPSLGQDGGWIDRRFSEPSATTAMMSYRGERAWDCSMLSGWIEEDLVLIRWVDRDARCHGNTRVSATSIIAAREDGASDVPLARCQRHSFGPALPRHTRGSQLRYAVTDGVLRRQATIGRAPARRATEDLLLQLRRRSRGPGLTFIPPPADRRRCPALLFRPCIPG